MSSPAPPAPRSRRLQRVVIRAARAVARNPWNALTRPAEVRRWLRRAFSEAAAPPMGSQYEAWLARRSLTQERVKALGVQCEELQYRPLISILTPVYNTPEAWLREAIESVRAQIYPNWQLCLADDCSSEPRVGELLREYSDLDTRIQVVYRPEQGGISAATNLALSLAAGEFVGMLDHDDELRPEALFEVVRLLNEQPELDVIYSDEDKKTAEGKRVDPFFKPDWSPNLLLTCNYIAHFLVYRRTIVGEVGGFRSQFDGSQDYDLVLRATEKTDRIAHLPAQLYSWRMIEGSAAASSGAKPYAYTAATKALEEALHRRGIEGVVEETWAPGRYRTRFALPKPARVSLIIPTRDKSGLLSRCLASVKKHNTYGHIEIIVVDSGPEEPLPAHLEPVVTAVVPYEGEKFNFSRAINAGAAASGGEYLLLLNDDTLALGNSWVEAMIEHAQRREVGAVGARLVDRHGEPVHEGIVLGLGGHLAGNMPFRYFGLGDSLRDVSAVTAACMMTRRDVFGEMGGFDEELRLAWNDVDYCLKLRKLGYSVVYTPWAVLRHDESSTRGAQPHLDDDATFRRLWGQPGELPDPYYNANFARDVGPWVLGE